MSVLQSPSVLQKVDRAEKAAAQFEELLEDRAKFENLCEKAFSEFRVACTHLRKESAALDAAGKKDVVWRFLCKLSKERSTFGNRIEEVLQVLMTSDAWMKAFVDDPEVDLNDLPGSIRRDFGQRCEDVGGTPNMHIRLVLIGSGRTAPQHLAALSRYNARARNNFFRVVGLLDAPERTAALCESPEAAKLKLERCPAASSLEALFELTEFDAAVLERDLDGKALPALLSRQKFVLVEPPLASTLEEALHLAKMSRQQVPLQRILISEPTEYLPELQGASQALERHAIGPIVSAQSVVNTQGPEAKDLVEQGVSCLLVPGLRALRALRLVLGPIEEVTGMEASPDARVGPAETPVACLLKHSNGVVSTLRLQNRMQDVPSPSQLIISGSKGDVVLQDGEVLGSNETESLAGYPKTLPIKTSSSRSLVDESQASDCLDKLWDLFARQVMPVARKDGKESVSSQVPTPPDALCNLESHLQDMSVAEAVRRSAATKHFESVPEIQI
eukprot:TRINITY_DN92926_c0_g1_i1.p1 TRINITY_DN92926_c0_g1~~TRINITY_DN92926_c0_g1_i1.p1  ORF type:complete len:503 (-),score=116.32 TRINITY_DN92926_c0_g1_i1:23-1531(-)